MKPKQYRKKPIVIEAIIWDGSDLCWAVIAQWLGGDYGVECRVTDAANGERRVYIQTLEGDMAASPGDYIIKGVKDEFYPCKPDIFEATYEAVA
jgi:hypothetical protein